MSGQETNGRTNGTNGRTGFGGGSLLLMFAGGALVGAAVAYLAQADNRARTRLRQPHASQGEPSAIKLSEAALPWQADITPLAQVSSGKRSLPVMDAGLVGLVSRFAGAPRRELEKRPLDLS